MRGDGFKQTNTVAGEMMALENGRTRWTRDTVLIVDEAAMISTKELARLAAAAARGRGEADFSGRRQAACRASSAAACSRRSGRIHGAATLKDVQRVKDAGAASRL